MKKKAGIEWIPCSERYPTWEAHYLVTVDDGRGSFTTCADWHVDDEENGAFCFCGTGLNHTFTAAGFHVSAWAKLPEPWEERSKAQ